MESWIKIASPRMIVNQCFAWLRSKSFFNSIGPKPTWQRSLTNVRFRDKSGH
jgi:hypothetical protein